MQAHSNRTLILALALVATGAHAGPFAVGTLVVNRVGDGSAALSGAAAPIFLDEYRLDGSLRQTISMPTADAGSNQTMTAAGSSTSEGYMSRSVDKSYIVLAGYDAPVNTAAVAGTDATVFNRIIGRVAADGTFDTSTNVTDYNLSNIRSVATVDGSIFLTAGQGGTGQQATAGVRSVNFGPGNLMTQLSADVTNTRVVSIQNGQIYVATMSGSFRGVNMVGSGVNYGSGQTITLLPGFDPSNASAQSTYDFAFATATTLYVADDRARASGGGLQRWDFNSILGQWVLTYTLTAGLPGATSTIRGLVCSPQANGEHVLYATSTEASANSLVTITDAGAASTFTILATAPANTRFRGLAFSPENANVPEVVVPSSITTIRGRLDSGNVASLGSDDNSYLRHCKFIVPNTLVPPIEVQVNGTTTKASTTGVTAQLTGKMANAGSFTHTVEQRNQVTLAYEDGATATVNVSESTVTSNSTGNHNEKIGSGGALQAKYFIRRTGPSAVAAFCYDAEWFRWTVN